MTTPPIEFEEQDRATFLSEIAAHEAAAMRRGETAITAKFGRRDGWYYARVEFVEAAE